MGLLDFLFRRTPKETDNVPDFDVTIANVALNKNTLDPAIYREIQRQLATNGFVDLTITLPDEDSGITPDPKPATRDTSGKPDAVEPVFCTIDYTDVAGHKSRRRITTRSVRCAGERSIIAAFCHERQALRHFRIDRISRVVTFDGEIFSATDFTENILGVDFWTARFAPARRARQQGGVNFSRYTSHAVIALKAVALADDQLHAEEAEVILRYLEDEAFALKRAGLIDTIPDPSVLNVIGRRIKRIRPTQTDLAAALGELRGRPVDQIDRFKRTVARLIAADGIVKLSEEQLLADLDSALTASGTTAWAELDRLIAQS